MDRIWTEGLAYPNKTRYSPLRVRVRGIHHLGSGLGLGLGRYSPLRVRVRVRVRVREVFTT